MSDKTVRQLADMVKTPLEQLLKQLQEAGLSARNADDIINDEQQMQLLTHLRKSHGKAQGASDNSPKRVTLERRKVTEIKQASVPGSSTKTISVEVRKKKTYIKRAEVDEKKPVEPVEITPEASKPVIIASSTIPEIILAPVETVVPVPEEVFIEQTAPVVEEKPQVQETIIAPVAESIKPKVDNKADVKVKPSHVKPNKAKVKIELDDTLAGEAESLIEPDVDIGSEAKFEALKIKEEKKNKEKSAKTKEAEEARKKQQEKERRLEESIKKNADKVRQQQVAKPDAGRKTQDEGGGGGGARSSGKDGKRGKRKGKQQPQQRTPVQFEGKHQFEMPSAPIVYDVTIPEMIVVTDLAQKMNVKAASVIKHLMKLGIMATINQTIDQDTAAILVEEMGHKVIMQSDDDLEQEMLAEALEEDNRIELPRAPIVTIMGHVDHGKTSLLDYIRKTRVAAGEAGGITQHIGAYQVKTDHGSVTFLDTPGHAAFTAMRARGADVTDVVIIVVAADDGVMPQTREAVEHAKAAKVPIIVAMNKMDKAGANPDKVMQELSTIGVQAEEWGGDVQFLKISAKTGQGIDELIEALIVQTEILELKAPVEGAAAGIVIESRLDKGRGAVATVLIQKGTLENGQMVLCGHEYGRVRAMFNENGKPIKEAGPCEPVEILGLSGTPNAGDEFLVLQNERIAK